MPPPTGSTVATVLEWLKKDSSRTLGVSLGSTVIKEPGTKITKEQSKPTPTIRLPTSLSEGADKYLLLCIDLDAPFVSWPVLGPVLHYFQSDLIPSAGSGGEDPSGGVVLTSSVPAVAPWIPANPPPFVAPHRYVFLLYQQPADFEEKKAKVKIESKTQRMRWDLAAFEGALGLSSGGDGTGGKLVGANYFVV